MLFRWPLVLFAYKYGDYQDFIMRNFDDNFQIMVIYEL
jgi:hypothetical protein